VMDIALLYCKLEEEWRQVLVTKLVVYMQLLLKTFHPDVNRILLFYEVQCPSIDVTLFPGNL
jgi:hypothetical protein